MADVVTSQIYDGARRVNAKFTNFSDGTGENGVTKLTVSSLVPNPGLHLKINRIRYSIYGGAVRIQWKGSPNVDLVYLPENTNILDFNGVYAGGYPNNGTSPTGDIVFTTVGFASGSGYTIELECIKGVQLI